MVNNQSGFCVTDLYPFNTDSVDYNKVIVQTIPVHKITLNIDDNDKASKL